MSETLVTVTDRRLTVDELFQRVRSQGKITRGRFKGLLRKAISRGLVRVVPGPGVMLELTSDGETTIGRLSAEGYLSA